MSAVVSVSMRFGACAKMSRPLVDVVWVDEPLCNAGLHVLLDRRQRLLSLVDAVSFVTMRNADISEAFAFDPHYTQEGFACVA